MRRFYSKRRRFKTAKSGRKYAAHSLDDALLRRLVEIGMHRQADDIVGEPLADPPTAPRGRVNPGGGVLMHRLDVIDRGRNALGLERRGKAVAVDALRQADGVLRPDRAA